MNNDDKPISAQGEEDDVMENEPTEKLDSDQMAVFDRRLVELLRSNSVSASIVDTDPESVLSPALRRMRDSLGSPEALVGRLVAVARSRGETECCEVRRETTAVGAKTDDAEVAVDPRELQELSAAYKSWQTRKHVGWSCEFRLQKQIGRGGQGVVYEIECLDKFLDNMALKVFSPAFYGSPQVYESEMKRMADVAAIVRKNRHDNLLQVERFKEHDKCFVMVMELISGFDLEYLLSPEIVGDAKDWQTRNDAEDWKWLGRVVYGPRGKRRWGLQPGVAVKIVEACLRGLDALHDQQIVHCDLKPANTMINYFGSVRLIDIGSAFHTSAPPMKPAFTARYMPPEVLEGGEWTPKSDLASMGYMLVELLSGQPDALVEESPGEARLLNLPLDSESADALDQPTRKRLAEVKRNLPSRLPRLIPEEARKSKRLMTLCSLFIDPIPENRFGSAEVAISGPDGTHEFLSELQFSNLGNYWPKVLEFWSTKVKAAEARASQSVSPRP